MGSIYWLQSIRKNDTRNFVYLFISKVRTTSKFSFYKQCRKEQHALFANELFLRKMLVSFLALIFLYTLKKIPWKSYVRFWEWNLKVTNADMKFCWYIRLRIKIICRRFRIIRPFTFWDIRNQDIWNVCLQTSRDNRIF